MKTHAVLGIVLLAWTVVGCEDEHVPLVDSPSILYGIVADETTGAGVESVTVVYEALEDGEVEYCVGGHTDATGYYWISVSLGVLLEGRVRFMKAGYLTGVFEVPGAAERVDERRRSYRLNVVLERESRKGRQALE